MAMRPAAKAPENETEDETAERYARVGMRRLVRRDARVGYTRKDGTFVPATKPPPKESSGDVSPHSTRRT